MDQTLVAIAFDANAINHRKHDRTKHRKKYVIERPLKTDQVDQIFSLATVDFWVIAIAELFCPNCYFLGFTLFVYRRTYVALPVTNH